MTITSIHWDTLTAAKQSELLQRPTTHTADTLAAKTADIITHVKTQGDQALYEYTATFDRVNLTHLQVSAEEIEHAHTHVSSKAKAAIELAINHLTQYHQAQYPNTIEVHTTAGVTCQRQARPIQRVGLYVPGGSAPLVSTVMMLAIPAKIAGCPMRILLSPPNQQGHLDPHLLFTASLCGIKQIFKVGGAQAIAAMAYGTKTIPKVDKIFGPGNAWVTQAKRWVAQDTHGASIDLPAGPSELLIIADHHANPKFIAADLLSQAEHGTDSHVLLLTTSQALAEQVSVALIQQLTTLPRATIAQQALAHSHIIIVSNMQQAFDISNQYAPEHLSLHIEEPECWIPDIQCAGAVFVGAWAAEALGDYITGSNHVLPTSGHARSISGLCINDFMTFMSIQTIDRTGLHTIATAAEQLAQLEGLTAHQRAVSLRLEKIT